MFYIRIRQSIGGVFRAVEDLWIGTLPPFVLTLSKRELAVIRNTGQRPLLVSSMRGLEPPPVSGLVDRHAKSQPAIPGRLGLGSHHVAVGTDSLRIPRLMF